MDGRILPMVENDRRSEMVIGLKWPMVRNGRWSDQLGRKRLIIKITRWSKMTDDASRQIIIFTLILGILAQLSGILYFKLKTDGTYLLIRTSIRIKFIWLFVEWKINMWNPISKLCQRRRLPRRCHFYHYQFLKVYGHFWFLPAKIGQIGFLWTKIYFL